MNVRYATVSARAGHRCEYCHAPEAIFNFHFEVEHVVPPGRGGADSDDKQQLGGYRSMKMNEIAVKGTNPCARFK